MMLPSRFVSMLAERREFPTDHDYYIALAREQLMSSFAFNIRDVPEAGGGQQGRDDDFIVAIAMSGGMDSSTLWLMAQESGLPVRLLYFQMGQPYARAELTAIQAVTGQLPEIVHLPLPFVQHRHILSGRNAILVLEMAAMLKASHQWGELWLGNLQGESPIVGGDKSRRFFGDMAAMLALTGQDVHIVNPLMGLNKIDLVRYWQARGDHALATLKQTYSCFAGSGAAARTRCGRCQACFNTWVAYTAAGVDCSDLFPEPHFNLHANKYRRVMKDALARQDFSHYSPSRIRHTLAAIDAYWHQWARL